MVQYEDRRKKNRTACTATDWTHGPQHMQTRAHVYLCVTQAHMLGPLLTRRNLSFCFVLTLSQLKP